MHGALADWGACCLPHVQIVRAPALSACRVPVIENKVAVSGWHGRRAGRRRLLLLCLNLQCWRLQGGARAQCVTEGAPLPVLGQQGTLSLG